MVSSRLAPGPGSGRPDRWIKIAWLFFSPGFTRWPWLGPAVKVVPTGSGAFANLARRQQMQLFGYCGNQALENPHLIFELLAFSLPLTVRDQPLHRISSKVRHATRAALLTHAAKLTKLIFRDPEVN